MTHRRIAAWLWLNHPPCRHWPHRNLRYWVRWVVSIGAVAVVSNGDEITAVGVARPIQTLADADDYYCVRERGLILWVDLAVSHNSRATAALLRIARERWGERAFIAFDRQKWATREVLPWRYFMGRFNQKEI